MSYYSVLFIFPVKIFSPRKLWLSQELLMTDSVAAIVEGILFIFAFWPPLPYSPVLNIKSRLSMNISSGWHYLMTLTNDIHSYSWAKTHMWLLIVGISWFWWCYPIILFLNILCSFFEYGITKSFPFFSIEIWKIETFFPFILIFRQ